MIFPKDLIHDAAVHKILDLRPVKFLFLCDLCPGDIRCPGTISGIDRPNLRPSKKSDPLSLRKRKQLLIIFQQDDRFLRNFSRCHSCIHFFSS